jgi:3-phosphoshikimate 1-carboxyvinyltransferase
MGNAGTAMRPLTAALALLGGDFELSRRAAHARAPDRRPGRCAAPAGLPGRLPGQPGYPPLRIGQPEVPAGTGPAHPVRGDVSSQFLTALLLALPLVGATQTAGDRDRVVGELISKPYIEITLQLLARFGITVQRDGWQRFTIPAGSRYRTPGSIHVEATPRRLAIS